MDITSFMNTEENMNSGVSFFFYQSAARRSLRRADATKGGIIGHELSEMCN